MGKGKKKSNKGKRRGGKKTRDDKDDDDSSGVGGSLHNRTPYVTQEHMERARLAAGNRIEDPLRNWTRIQNEDCPICMLPLSFRSSDMNYCVGCGKTVCWGCVVSTVVLHGRESGDAKMATEKAFTCPYCRSNTTSYDDKSQLENEMKRANNGNGEAMHLVGNYCFHGQKGLQQDKAEGLKWYHRAVEAGDGHAAFYIGRCYLEGDGVEKDHGKAFQYYQKAAELGFVPSFTLIGYLLVKKGDIEEGMLNYRKAAMCGISDEWLFDQLRIGFKNGFITKEEYAFTLRENQKACNEMKSEAREVWRRINVGRQN